MKILMIGDIFGKPGREIINQELANIKSMHEIDFIIANGENATHGKSISKKHYLELKKAGVDVVTSGNHIFKLKEVEQYIKEETDLLRPNNMSKNLPGQGFVLKKMNSKTILTINLMGRSFMDLCDSPYDSLDEILKNNKADIILVDFHAEATAEKKAFAYNYDGQITALVGTHTHVQTADEQILPQGTFYITDLGMTGNLDSVIGVSPDEVIIKEKTGLPVKFVPLNGEPTLCGVILTINDKNKVIKFERIQFKNHNELIKK
ncbi:TIGR00282 family metallophosphoesterase [Spiroplasma endosymbiont of Labia minor]|uniref:TIGR00282 family metallophosphoesterase n=1 Tax=Spiroplasma endosymbiont of Labia minor TaxID=3066305 RepID=UPI0030CD0066